MNESIANQSIMEKKAELQSLENTIQILLDGLQELIRDVPVFGDKPPLRPDLMVFVKYASEMMEWCGKVPTPRIWDTLKSLIRHVYGFLKTAVHEGRMKAPDDQNASLLPRLHHVLMEIGPNITTSDDQMAAFVLIPSELAELWSVDRIKECLKRKGIVYGIEENQLESIFSESKFDQVVRVALGKSPVIGNNAEIEDTLQLFKKSKLLVGKNFHWTDYKAHHLFVPVKKGDLILSKIAAKTGENGCDVFGHVINSPEGLDKPLPEVENCALEGGGLHLVSKVDGCAYSEQNRIFVTPSLTIKENVDFETGDVDASVSVTVGKDILAGMKVQSAQDVAVKGVIESCTVIAGGSVFCQCGINGKGDTKVQARRNVEAVHINTAKVIAGDYITIHGPIMNSEVYARRVASTGANGLIIGGVIRAWEDVCATEIGSKMGVRTEIILGSELDELKLKTEELTSLLKTKKQMKSQAEATLRQLHSSKNADKQNIEKLITEIKALMAEMDEIQFRYDKVMCDLAYSETCVRMVRVSKVIYPGTNIQILNQSRFFKEICGPVNIKYSIRGLLTLPYKDRSFTGDEGEE